MDLFGNPTPSSKKKTFKLTLSSEATTKDKKTKSEIYACVKYIENLKEEFENTSGQIHLVKTHFHKAIGESYSELEIKWTKLFYCLLDYLNQSYVFLEWETELIYHLLYREIESYKQFNLNTDLLTSVYNQLSDFEQQQKGYAKIQFSNVETASDKHISKASLESPFKNKQQPHSNNSDSIRKFKRIYKVLLKQIHPDILFVSTEESKKRIQELTDIWENKAYYQLLKFKHNILPESEIELTSEDLNLILQSVNSEQLILNTNLKQLKTSKDYTFYVDSFYNLSEHIITRNIDTYKQILDQKDSEIRTILNQFSTPNRCKDYLEQHRILLSEQLNIKYLIEDLYHRS